MVIKNLSFFLKDLKNVIFLYANNHFSMDPYNTRYLCIIGFFSFIKIVAHIICLTV